LCSVPESPSPNPDLAALVLAGAAWAGQGGKSLVKGFLLAGQSSMEGEAMIEMLDKKG
jgi:hypothetical protein